MKMTKMYKRIGILALTGIILMGIWGCKAKKNNTNTTEEGSTTVGDIVDWEIVDIEGNDGNSVEYFDRITITIHGGAETNIGLSWYTPVEKEKEGKLENKAEYGNDIQMVEYDSLKAVDYISFQVESGKAEYDEEAAYHQTVIKGLKENTKYYYRVGNEETNEWSKYGTFTVGGSTVKEYKFVVITDTQGDHLPDGYFAADTIKSALTMAKSSAFMIHCGDVVDDSAKEMQWEAMLNTGSELYSNNIVVPVVGNHDSSNNSFWQHFSLTKTNNHKTTGIYYSYDYGNTHFTILDTNKVSSDGMSYIDDEQLNWLEEDLKKAKADGKKWLIVAMHRGSYTVGEHASGEKYAGENGTRLRLGEIFEKYGVKLVLQGHDHCPSVTHPISKGKANKGGDGVTYINIGASGSKTYTFEENMDKEYYELFAYIDKKQRDNDIYQNYAVVNVDDEKLQVTMYEKNLYGNLKKTEILHTVTIR